jgi:hypothetical protein
VELTNGRLPWATINDPGEVGRAKEKVRDPSEHKNMFGGCPRDYIAIMKMVDDLRYFDTPPYAQIYGMLHDALPVGVL